MIPLALNFRVPQNQKNCGYCQKKGKFIILLQENLKTGSFFKIISIEYFKFPSD